MFPFSIPNFLKFLISEINFQKDKMRESEVHKALSRLGRQVNHDIQSPLGALNTALAQIDENRGLAIELLKKSVARIQNIVADLRISEAEVNNIRIVKEKTELNQFIDYLIKEKKAEYGPMIKFHFNPNKQAVYLDIDRGGMARAISNIINNGIEAVKGKKPVIEIQVIEDSKFVKLLIIDNGPGIPENIRDKIFNYGFTAGKIEGSGTGLSQAADVVNLHYGSLEIKKKTVNENNTIIIVLKKLN